MKILFLNYEYPPLGGGASVATEALLKEWAKSDEDEVHLVTAAIGETLEHIQIGKNVFVHRLPIGKNPEKLHSQSMRDIFAYSFAAWKFLRTFIPFESQKEKFDITLAFFTVPCGFLAYLLKVFYRIPYAVSLRGADVPGFSEKYDNFYLFMKPLIRFLWRKAVVVIPNSKGITALAKKTSPKQEMVIIENGVDTENFVPSADARKGSPIVFLSTSRLTPRKGIDKLVEAFAVAVKYSKVPIELWLIGDGEQKPVLEERVKNLGITEKVKFLGRVDHAGLAAYYQQAHVFVLPSKNEGMSNAALEALAAGLALVVSDTGGMEELVADGKNGLFVDPDMTDQFAETLVSLAHNAGSVLKFGLESRRRAEEKSWKKVAQSFLEQLANALKEK